ncbi:putative lipoprotein [Pseudomonas chlororaphis O6]|uniref:Lipoprotein n=2 Tax=Pseudomonas chlororaphis TaxID=587753 RepID=A0AB33WX73_9PSED|nr:putative lipoprotein [Pseudomonas chlororaphis O6]
MRSSGMPHALIALLMLVALPLWAAEPRDLAWSEMIPPDAPAEVPNMKPLHDLSQMSDALAAESAPAAKQEMPNAPVVQSLDGLSVRLPGYIVPLEVSEEGRTTEFLLVPYFGACIHVPPPPSNQIVHVKSEVGVKLDELYQPYWIEGPMQVKASTSDIADAGYQMEAQKIYVYELQE